MLIVVMTLGEMLFNSRTVGRLGSLLFFFFGSLSYVPFLQKQVSIRAAIEAVKHRGEFLPSIFPYRGETWGTWSQVNYLNQRHLASAIGIFLLVLVFLVIRYRAGAARKRKTLLVSRLCRGRSRAPLIDTPALAAPKIPLGPNPSRSHRRVRRCRSPRLIYRIPEGRLGKGPWGKTTRRPMAPRYLSCRQNLLRYRPPQK